MTRLSLAERLAQPQPLLADGAMGTLLHSDGNHTIDACFDALNLTQAAVIQHIHAQYIAAGADLIETNSFGANRHKLSEHGLADKVAAICTAAVAIAQAAVAASGRTVYIAGSVGPIGVSLKPYGWMTPDDAQAIFREQLTALIEAGVDAILLETFADHEELLLAVKVARSIAPDLPIIAQATFSADRLTYTGHPPARVAHDLAKSGATVIGVNCGNGPARTANILQAMKKAVPNARFSAMPNAGFPETIGNRVMYPAKADYFGDYARTFQGIGAQIIGGCCGTTPEHIAAMRAALDHPKHTVTTPQLTEQTADIIEPTVERPTYLMQRLNAGQFTITVEVAPPRSHVVDKMQQQIRLLRDAGADLIDIADTPAAKMKMSAWAACYLVQDNIGIETVLHFPTRGRNLLRVQGDLLAAHALGLRNLFVTMGDPTRIGDYPEAADNYDIAPSDLIRLIKQQMNAGKDMAGNSIGKPTAFVVGCALNMAAEDPDKEIKLLRKKLDAGADFALGQAVFDPPRVVAFRQRYEELEGKPLTLPVIMGVMPLHSLKYAQFLHNEIPGIIIPDAIFQRLEAAGENIAQEGVQIASELIEQMREYIQGAYIIPGYGQYELAAQVANAIASVPLPA
jgi:homocysteine S-methyltransferase